MAYSLSIGAVDVSAGDYKLIEYNPKPGDGKNTVADRAIISITSSSSANRDAAISNITTEFTKAYERRRMGTGSRVYVTFTPDGSGTTYRSELFANNVRNLPGRVAVDRNFRGAHLWTEQLTTRVIIDFERRGYWEENSETELSLKNNSGSGTGGINIYSPTVTSATYTASTISFTQATRTIADSANGFGSFAADDIITVRGTTNNDGTYTIESAAAGSIVVHEDALTDEAAGASVSLYHVQNYVTVNSTISGDLKAPLRLTYENTYNDADGVTNLYVGMVRGDFVAMPLLLEAENGNEGTLITPTIQSSAAYSGGEALRVAWGTSPEAEVLYWDIPKSFASACAGRYFKAIMVINPSVYIFGQNSRWRGNIKMSAAGSAITPEAYLYQGRQVVGGGIGTTVIDLGDFQLPPWFDDGGNSQSFRFSLNCEDDSGNDGIIDYIALIPAQEFRQYLPNTAYSYIEYTDTLEDDGAVNQVKVLDSNNEASGTQSVSGSPLMVQPGDTGRVLFLPESQDIGREITSRIATIRAYYRPRKSTL